MGLIDILYDSFKKNWKEVKKRAVCAPYYLLSLQARIRIDHARKSYEDPLLVDYLKNKYSKYNLLTCNGHSFPIVVFDCKDGPLKIGNEKLKILQQPIDKKWNPHSTFKGHEYYWMMRSKIGSHNNHTFIMKNLNIGPSPVLTCGVAKFFDVLRTSDCLEWELLLAVQKTKRIKNSSVESVSNFTPFRNRLHEKNNDPLQDGAGRAAAVGISVLFVYATDKGTKLLLRRRGKLSVAPRKEMHQVLPAGYFQAHHGNYIEEYSIEYACLCEYYYEVFGKKEPEKPEVDATSLYYKPEVEELKTMLKNDRAELYVTGVAVDLLNLRPEILVVLYIKDKERSKKIIAKSKIDPEHASTRDLPAGKEAVLHVTYSENPDKVFQDYDLTPENITPPGAAALWLGIKMLRSVLSKN